MKTKGQPSKVAKLEPLARCLLGEVPEWSNGTGLQPAKALTSFHGFESRPLRTNETSPATALTAAKESIHTAEAAQTRNLIMWPKAVNRKEIHNDVPQLPYRYGEGRFLRKDKSRSALEMPALSSSRTSQTRSATPAAIAGVTRKLL